MSAGNPDRIAEIADAILEEYGFDDPLDVVGACQTILARVCMADNGCEVALAGVDACAADMRDMIRRELGH